MVFGISRPIMFIIFFHNYENPKYFLCTKVNFMKFYIWIHVISINIWLGNQNEPRMRWTIGLVFGIGFIVSLTQFSLRRMFYSYSIGWFQTQKDYLDRRSRNLLVYKIKNQNELNVGGTRAEIYLPFGQLGLVKII